MTHIRSLHYWPDSDEDIEEVSYTRRDRAIFALLIVAAATLEIFFMIRATGIALH